VNRVARLIAGVAVLVALLVIGGFLIPPYVDNFRLQRYINALIDDPATASQAPTTVQAEIVSKAASLGLPLRTEDVQVSSSNGALRVDALYVVHVDLAGYTVDLHFRPAAGGS
jgi:hypothetical protein